MLKSFEKHPISPFKIGKNLPLVDNPWDVGNLIDDFITWNLAPAQTPQLFTGSSSDTEWQPTTKQLRVTWCCWSGLTCTPHPHSGTDFYGITLAFFYDFKILFAGDVGEDICSQEAGRCCCELNELTHFFKKKKVFSWLGCGWTLWGESSCDWSHVSDAGGGFFFGVFQREPSPRFLWSFTELCCRPEAPAALRSPVIKIQLTCLHLLRSDFPT